MIYDFIFIRTVTSSYVDTSDFLMVSRGQTILGQPLNSSDEHFDSMVPILENNEYTMFDYDSRDRFIYWISVSLSRYFIIVFVIILCERLAFLLSRPAKNLRLNCSEAYMYMYIM